jgi:hypothetical protein
VIKDNFTHLFDRSAALSKYLPNAAMARWRKKTGKKVLYFPRYVNSSRVKIPGTVKTIDVCCIGSMHTAHRNAIRRFVEASCAKHGLSCVAGEIWGPAYLEILNRSSVAVCVCDRASLTGKYVEAAACGCHILGNIPQYPEEAKDVIQLTMRSGQFSEYAGTKPPTHEWAKQFTSPGKCLENFNAVAKEVMG